MDITEEDPGIAAAEEARNKSIEQAMEAEGVSPTTPVQADYFGFTETHQHFFPDGVTYVMFSKMNEGDRRRYLDAVNNEVRLQKTTGDAIMKMQAGQNRHILLSSAIVGWNLTRDGKPVVFSKGSPGSTLNQWMDVADPKIIDGIEKAIREKNPWLMADISVEEIDKQIEELYEMRELKVKEEEGKDS